MTIQQVEGAKLNIQTLLQRIAKEVSDAAMQYQATFQEEINFDEMSEEEDYDPTAFRTVAQVACLANPLQMLLL